MNTGSWRKSKSLALSESRRMRLEFGELELSWVVDLTNRVLVDSARWDPPCSTTAQISGPNGRERGEF